MTGHKVLIYFYMFRDIVFFFVFFFKVCTVFLDEKILLYWEGGGHRVFIRAHICRVNFVQVEKRRG